MAQSDCTKFLRWPLGSDKYANTNAPLQILRKIYLFIYLLFPHMTQLIREPYLVLESSAVSKMLTHERRGFLVLFGAIVFSPLVSRDFEKWWQTSTNGAFRTFAIC